MDTTDLLVRVKDATRMQHQRLESLLPLSSERLTLESYRELLVAFFGLFRLIETAVGRVHFPEELELPRRRRSQLLQRDLLALGLSEQEINRLPCPLDMPSITGSASALGAMYVLEGSTLGGQYVAKIVHDRLQLSEQTGCSFFSSHGQDVGSMWRKFCTFVRQNVVAPEAQEQFVASAQSTFAAFENWVARKDVSIA
jgi:heme oxygenase (biliverdin-IX-beta and delta-forming)